MAIKNSVSKKDLDTVFEEDTTDLISNLIKNRNIYTIKEGVYTTVF